MAVPQPASGVRWPMVKIIAAAVVVFLAVYNLTNYPVTWFDEGSHLRVSKALVRFGVYADYSSEGFRYKGPLTSIGPTVVLPIAAAFQLLGVGLLQGRLVMVLYLLATVGVFYRLARGLGGQRLAWVATALLMTSRGVSLLEYGRQALGEVPGLFFMVAALMLWFRLWERAGWRRLGLVGLLFGLAMITKPQYFLVLAPTLGLAWLANLLYYRAAPQRTLILPALVAVAVFALMQIILYLYIGQASAGQYLAGKSEYVTSAALALSPDLVIRGLRELFSLKVYLGWLFPALVFGFLLALPRRREGQQWGILLLLAAANLAWYVFASISWLRYAFPALAISSLFVARFFHDLTDGLKLESLREILGRRESFSQKDAMRWAMLAWLGAMILLPLGQTLAPMLSQTFNAPAAMAAYLDEHVPREALIETWEPEIGFLTDHNYHFPPSALLNTAVGYVWRDGAPPAQDYDFVLAEHPDYVLVGRFARWVDLYSTEALAAHYRVVTRIGEYELYSLNP